MTTQQLTGAREEERQLGATYESVCAAAPAVIAEALGEAPETLDPGLWSVRTKSTKHEISLGRVGPDCRLVVKSTPVVSAGRLLVSMGIGVFVMLLSMVAVNELAWPPALIFAAMALGIGVGAHGIRRLSRDQQDALRARDVLTHRLLRAFEDAFRDPPVPLYRVATADAGARVDGGPVETPDDADVSDDAPSSAAPRGARST